MENEEMNSKHWKNKCSNHISRSYCFNWLINHSAWLHCYNFQRSFLVYINIWLFQALIRLWTIKSIHKIFSHFDPVNRVKCDLKFASNHNQIYTYVWIVNVFIVYYYLWEWKSVFPASCTSIKTISQDTWSKISKTRNNMEKFIAIYIVWRHLNLTSNIFL